MAKIPKAAIDRLKRIHYLHNTAKNPYKKSQGMFAMDVEPAGQYFTPLDRPPTDIPEGFIGGTKEFKNPLVIPEGGAYDDPTNWKRELSKRYGGKTGKALTNAIRKDGYDAIITQGKYGPGEAVDLYKGKGGVDMPSALIPAAGAAALGAQSEDAEAGVKSQLAMDLASRMKRAKEMGFDIRRPFYHGTDQDITAFSPERFGGATGAESAKQGVWTTDKRRVAQSYADYAATGAKIDRLVKQADAAGDAGDWDKYDELITEAERLESSFADPKNRLSGQNIMPVASRGRYLKHDAKGESFEGLGEVFSEIIRRARAGGYDGVEFKNLDDAVGLTDSLATHRVTFDPSNIRSVNAAFDPAKADSSDLLAGIGGLAPIAGGAALMAPTDRAQAGMINPYSPTQIGTALLQRGGPLMQQEAVPARFPALHRVANLIGGIQDPTGLALDTSGTADYLRNFGEGNPSFLRALGAMPF